jgi:hypothetical protein
VNELERMAQQFRLQADASRVLGSALYGVLLDRCAEDLDAGGLIAEVLEDHLERRRRDALPLRLLAGVHAVVLTGRAPELAEFYPSAGGDADGDREALWRAFRKVVAGHRDEVRRWLDHAPQTNEVGRAAALAGGLRHVVAESRLPVRLVEIGASAGLNLRADHFRIEGKTATSGPADSPLVLRDAWLGVAPPEVSAHVIERVGYDLAPIDPTTPNGQLRLTAFVWADQLQRLTRLRAAFDVAREVPAALRSGDAIEVVQRLTRVEGSWTLLWHSVFRQYLDGDGYAELSAAIDAVGAAATPTARFAHLMLEPEPTSTADAFPVTLTTWPGGVRRVLGTAPAHGLPVTWLG